MAQENREVFKDILDNGETIIEIFKPNKAKAFWSMFFKIFPSWFWLSILVACMCGGIIGTFIAPLEDGSVEPGMFFLIAGISFAILLVIMVVLVFVFHYLNYKKTFYAYTDKRILIRHGIIGVDYKALDRKFIGATTVNVSLLDKMVKKNTGTITFGSMASPIGQAQVYKFQNIVNPYDVCRRVKIDLDSSNNNEN